MTPDRLSEITKWEEGRSGLDAGWSAYSGMVGELLVEIKRLQEECSNSKNSIADLQRILRQLY